jgi:hypothetical protein
MTTYLDLAGAVTQAYTALHIYIHRLVCAECPHAVELSRSP